jgi:hypothetical protein
MQKSAQATWLLLIVEMAIVGGVPLLVWTVLPAGFRSWATEGEGVAGTIVLIVVVSVGMGALAMLGFRVWQFLASRIYGRENIDAQIAEWSKRR